MLEIVRGDAQQLAVYDAPPEVGDGSEFDVYFMIRPFPAAQLPYVIKDATVDPPVPPDTNYTVNFFLDADESWQLEPLDDGYSVGILFRHKTDSRQNQVLEVDRLMVLAPSAQQQDLGSTCPPVPPYDGRLPRFHIDGPAYQTVHDHGNVDPDPGDPYQIDLSLGNCHRLRLTRDVEIEFVGDPGPVVAEPGSNILIVVEQDINGGHELSYSSDNTIKWSGGVVPMVSDDPNSVTIIAFFFYANTFLGQMTAGFE